MKVSVLCLSLLTLALTGPAASAAASAAGQTTPRGSALLGTMPPAPNRPAVPATPPRTTTETMPGAWARPGEWVPVGGAHASYLQVPAGCPERACALVVVSHPRAQSAERLRDSPQAGTLVAALLRANYAVLLSGDGGPATWGSPGALSTVGVAHATATRRFNWSGRTYALGLSMGGLMSLRSALPGSPYPVSGVALIDAWADLDRAWGSDLTRRAEIDAAYRLGTRPLPDLNPLVRVMAAPPMPLFVVNSLDDTTVKASLNTDRLLGRAQQGVSEFIPLTGPHLGGNRFSPAVAQRLVGFFDRLAALPLPEAGSQAGAERP
ncbi:alpha/beta hydrolase [Deinococcus aquaticus]|uniref:Alpha/beta hydrolase n=1 Tax=Deinococcus aquaticus TaxID=328692 RepID=A0ABY7UZQ0_9DEIO|nr:alpha/beta hydrolase [Deinococcus aquaticus]WDA58350.1 alpha/beta hydrolase [Deinococcus aquaticus]